MRTLFYILLLFVIASCKTTEYVVKEKTIYDTIEIEKTITDTIIQEKEIEKIRDIKTKVFLPCPEDDEKGGSGRNESGDNYADWEYDEEKGGYNIELYCAEQINSKDSLIRKLRSEIDTYKSNYVKKESDTKITIEKNHWWQSFFKNIWKVLFFMVAILWFLGITPRFILKRF